MFINDFKSKILLLLFLVGILRFTPTYTHTHAQHINEENKIFKVKEERKKNRKGKVMRGRE